MSIFAGLYITGGLKVVLTQLKTKAGFWSWAVALFFLGPSMFIKRKFKVPVLYQEIPGMRQKKILYCH